MTVLSAPCFSLRSRYHLRCAGAGPDPMLSFPPVPAALATYRNRRHRFLPIEQRPHRAQPRRPSDESPGD